MNSLVLYVSLLFLLLCGCDEKSKRSKSTELDFALNYFSDEISKLEKADLVLTKKLDYDQKIETIIDKNPNWKKELLPFTENLKNESSGLHSYKKDSLINGVSKIVSLVATDATSTIKSLLTYSTNEINDSLTMILHVSNSYYQSSDTLHYYGMGNFKIKTENLPGIGKKLGFILEGKTSLIPN